MLLRTFTRSLIRRNRGLTNRHQPVDYAVCIDIECTCDEPTQIYPMEVIELACLKLDLKKIQARKHDDGIELNSTIHPCFHSYVRPVVNPELTLFCQELTGIMQETVNKAETIDKVVNDLLLWLKEQNLIDDNYSNTENFAFASCGNFDLNLLSPIISDCQFNNHHELPIYFREWINVKKTFVNHKGEWPKGLYHMLELLDENPIGRIHSAMDDCKNLAKVVECLQQEGCKFYVTNRINNNQPHVGFKDL